MTIRIIEQLKMTNDWIYFTIIGTHIKKIGKYVGYTSRDERHWSPKHVQFISLIMSKVKQKVKSQMSQKLKGWVRPVWCWTLW